MTNAKHNNKNDPQKNHPFRTDVSRSHWVAKINFTDQILALDSTVVNHKIRLAYAYVK